MSLRDDLLPVFGDLRQLPVDFGLRRFTVTMRRRVWSGATPGQGNAVNQDLVIAPSPRVRDAFAAGRLSPQELEYISANSNVVQGHLYKVDKITPLYTNDDQTTGGYTSQQLRMWPNPDARHIENIVLLVGDDGYARECVQVIFEQDRAFGYSMLVKEQDRPRTPLMSIAITPAAPAMEVDDVQQMTVTATFVGGTTSDITTLALWGSSNPAVATVDAMGVVTAVSAGTANITAAMTGTRASTTVTVT